MQSNCIVWSVYHIRHRPKWIFFVTCFLLSEVTTLAGSVFLSFAPNKQLASVSLGWTDCPFSCVSSDGISSGEYQKCFHEVTLVKMDNLPYLTNSCCFCVFCSPENHSREQEYCHHHTDYTETAICLSVYYTSCAFFGFNYKLQSYFFFSYKYLNGKKNELKSCEFDFNSIIHVDLKHV